MIATSAVIGLRRGPGIPHWNSGTLHGMPMRSMPEPPPRIIMTFGKFQLNKEIGQGAMGSIWRARDVLSGGSAVVKLARMDLHSFILQEAKIMARLAHRNIAAYVDSGEVNGAAYLAMEYIPGKTVAALLKNNELDLPRALDIVSQVCFGLSYLQKKGIVHCDMKGDNIMVAPDGTVKIIDFGLARSAGKTAGGCGTIWNRPPEQANNQPVDTRSDIYSLGVTFTDILIYLSRQGRVSEEMQDRISQITQHMAAKEPADRYQSPLDIVADIKKLKIE